MVHTGDDVRLHVPFTKSAMADDGKTFVVFGKITGDDLDLDGQRVSVDWAKKAVPEWYDRAGNIRWMHQPKPIGKAIGWEQLDDGFYVRADIDDPETQRQISKGILNGFSIGVKNAHVTPDRSAPRGIIDGGIIVEVSAVDAPANPTARVREFGLQDAGTLKGEQGVTLWKAAGAEPLSLPDDGVLRKVLSGAPETAPAPDGTLFAADTMQFSPPPTPDGLPPLDAALRPELAPQARKSAPADAEPVQKSGTEPPKSAPEGYPKDKDQYADPETYGFPVNSAARVRSAMAYYNGGKGKQGRESRWEAIGRKIAAKAKHFFGGDYHLDGDQIVGGKDEKSLYRDVLFQGAVVLADQGGRLIMGERVVEKDAAALADDYPAGAQIGAAEDYRPFPLELRDDFRAVPMHTEVGGRPGIQDGDDHVPPPFREPVAPTGTNPNDMDRDVVDLGQEGTRSERERFTEPKSAASTFTTQTGADAFPVDRPEIAPNQPGDAARPMVKTAASDRTLTLRALIGDLSVLQKNGVQSALGPIVRNMIFQMVAEEVEEDGGTGSDAHDIFEIAKAYCAVVEFAALESAEGDEHARVLPASFVQMDAAGALRERGIPEPNPADAEIPVSRRYYRHTDRDHVNAAVQAAHDALVSIYPRACQGTTKLAEADPEAEKGLSAKCAACGCSCGKDGADPDCDCDCATCKGAREADEARKAVEDAVAKAVAEAVAPLNEQLTKITAERDALQKRFDEEPDPLTPQPVRMVLSRNAPEAADPEAKSLSAAEYMAKAADITDPWRRIDLLYRTLGGKPRDPESR